jgi:glycosyltransferase involved in cell wall biosynthesis
VLALRRKFPELLITVIAFQYPYKIGWYQWNGISVMALNGRNKGGIHRLLVWINAWNCLRKLKKEGSIIGLLSFWCTETALIGKWFARLSNLKHYCWILGQDARKSNGLVKLIKPSSNQLIALSDFLQEEFEKNHGVRPSQVIPNAIDPTSFPPLQRDRSIHLIGVGSLISLKGYDVFLSVVKKLIVHFPSLKAVICGKGPEEKLLQDSINESGLIKNVLLLGEKPHQEVLQLLQESKILLHPSSYEGYSTVCLEALYAGAHVVSFIKPDQHKIEQWHLVHSVEEMEQKVMEVLSKGGIDHKRVLLHAVDESAVAVMKLFDIEVTAS